MRETDSQNPNSASATPLITTPRRPPHRPYAGLLATAAAVVVVALLGGLFAWRGSLGSLVGGRPHATVTTVTTPTVAPTATPRPLTFHALIIGSNGGDVSAILPSGARNWRTFTGGEITALASDNSQNVVYAGVWFGKSHGALYALQGNTGHILWHKAGMVPMTIQATNGMVYVGTSGIYPNASATNFAALRASDGATQWTFDTGKCDGSQFAVAQGTVFIDTGCALVAALDAASGHELWNAHVKAQGTPVIVGSAVYIGYYALSVGDGNVLWNNSALNPNASTAVAVGNGQVYIASSLEIYAVAPDTGALIWNTVISGWFPSDPAAGPGGIYVTSGNALDGLSATNRGNTVWSAPVNTTHTQAPLLVGNTLYVGSSDRALYAFSATDGKQLWRVAMAGRVVISPIAQYS